MTRLNFRIFHKPETGMRARKAFLAWGMGQAHEFESVHLHRHSMKEVTYTRRDPIDPGTVWTCQVMWTKSRMISIKLDSEPVSGEDEREK